MILIKTKIGQSAKHGIGLFADQFIPKGTPTWKFNPRFDMALSQEDLDEMSETSREQMIWYCYYDFDINKYILCFDDQRFINHSSKNFNIISTPTQDVAARDIEAGEELLCDYNLFDKAYWERRKIDQSTLKD